MPSFKINYKDKRGEKISQDKKPPSNKTNDEDYYKDDTIE